MLEISKTGTLSKHPRGPHFILRDQTHLKETRDGVENIELPLDKLVAYIEPAMPKPVIIHHDAEDAINADGKTVHYDAYDEHKRLTFAELPNEAKYRIEAAALLANNSGVVFHHWDFLNGERDPAMLFFAHEGRDGEDEGGIRIDGKGKEFLSLHTLSVANILGHKRDYPGDEHRGSYNIIEAHILTFLKSIGLEPNMQRINADFCKTCT